MKHLLFSLLILPATLLSQEITTFPAFKTDVPVPTADKPQSKTWYMEDTWWALLPHSSGPCLWQRVNGKWIEHESVRQQLKGIPGRADVWYEKGITTAVSVADSALSVFRIKRTGKTWETNLLATLKAPQGKIETATIAKDAKGNWWVAADAGKAIHVWYSINNTAFTKINKPLITGIADDDICTITALPESVMVTWSDQVTESVNCREHKNGDDPNTWQETVVIEKGNKTADDHLHTAVSANGTVWLVMKNSLDKIGSPQLVLRTRNAEGNWTNIPYGMLTQTEEPSRPVVVTTSDPSVIVASHSVYRRSDKNSGTIVAGFLDVNSEEVLTQVRTIIAPDRSLNARINNVTVPKQAYPAGKPFLLLASDEHGNLYEGWISR